jgi:hypothetical protein
MARFLAIHSVPDISEEKFQESLDGVKNWRPDRRTTIVKVYCNLAEGKLFSECEAVEQAHFEDWIKQVGWPCDVIYKVDMVHQVGHIWKV